MEDTGYAPPALFLHCSTIYSKMLEKAARVEADDGSKMIVYKGFLTQLVAQQALSVPYYTFATRALKSMGCIRQVKRGGGRSPSEWELIKAPTQELFNKLDPKYEEKKAVLGRKGENAILKQGIADLSTRVYNIEKALGIVNE